MFELWWNLKPFDHSIQDAPSSMPLKGFWKIMKSGSLGYFYGPVCISDRSTTKCFVISVMCAHFLCVLHGCIPDTRNRNLYKKLFQETCTSDICFLQTPNWMPPQVCTRTCINLGLHQNFDARQLYKFLECLSRALVLVISCTDLTALVWHTNWEFEFYVF